MKPIHQLLSIPAIFFCTFLAAQTYTLKANITGIKVSKGVLYVSLFNNKNGYPKDHTKAFRVSHSTITGNVCSILFEGIPKGVYAIACYQDENNNGKMDTNFLGIPTECTGTSNNAKGFMGPPSFGDACFNVSDNSNQEIRMHY